MARWIQNRLPKFDKKAHPDGLFFWYNDSHNEKPLVVQIVNSDYVMFPGSDVIFDVEDLLDKFIHFYIYDIPLTAPVSDKV